jgi:aminoglycoside 6'-N-acetyltransferase I
MDIAIRRVGVHDVSLFERVAADVFDGPIDADRLSKFLAKPVNQMVVAVYDGQVIGQAAVIVHLHPDKPPELYVDEVAVASQHRQNGVARRMLDELVVWGIERGCQSAWLGTEMDNLPAQVLYTRYAQAVPIVMYQWDLDVVATRKK